MLKSIFDENNLYEIGVDECARGPLFGRVYTCAVILPKEFNHHEMKDSKKIKSKKKMRELSEYIKSNATAWYIDYIEASEIDEINIRQAVLKSMRTSIEKVLSMIDNNNKAHIIVDGNDFPKYNFENNPNISHTCVKQADNTYSFVAAASILAKCEHDEYINFMCDEYPILQERYFLNDNMGYGTQKHLEGIKKYGISQWHRRTYGCCKSVNIDKIKKIDC
jgi:ribonuclease HII